MIIGTGAESGNDAAARSDLYRVLAGSFGFPGIDFFDAVTSGEYSRILRGMIGATPLIGCLGEADALEAELAGFRGDFDEFCAEYIRLFEVGAGQGRVPCALYGGEYTRRPRLDVMEELVRFYRYFDVALSDREREMPDHISVELEFLHYLAFRESRALQTGADARPFRRAQADFIERHPGNWVPQMRERLKKQAPARFFHGLVSVTAEILAADLEHLKSGQ